MRGGRLGDWKKGNEGDWGHEWEEVKVGDIRRRRRIKSGREKG